MKSRNWWALLCLGGITALQGCSSSDRPEVADPMPPPPPPECQKFWDFEGFDDVQLLAEEDPNARPLFLNGPEETQNTAEYHDCQRFVVPETLSGPHHFSDGIFAIFAVKKSNPAQAHIADPVYAQAAATGTGFALPAAKIWAEAEYEPLGIKWGFNCLYLHPEDDGSWQAYLRREGGEEQNCQDPLAVTELGSPTGDWYALKVTRSQDRDPDPEAYPIVARWIWHPIPGENLHEYKMGVWCDQAWCEVGSEHAEGATPSHADPNVPVETQNTKEFRVNAWYDEQILAGYNGSLYVTDIVGTIIPAHNLGKNDEDTFTPGRWVPTAKVALTPLDPGNPPQTNPFGGKLNLDLSLHGAPLNQIFLCRGSWEGTDGEAGCQEDGVEEPGALNPQQIHRDEGFQWWGKIERRGGGPPVTRYFPVARCPYDFQVAGTARWRWLADDPGIWMRCIDGCCELRGGN